jgi:hypothetical protein
LAESVDVADDGARAGGRHPSSDSKLPSKDDTNCPKRRTSPRAGVTTDMAPALIITLSWLAIMLLVFGVCRMAAGGDRAMRAASAEGRGRKQPFERTGIRTPTPQYVAYRLTHHPQVELQAVAPEHVRDRAQQDLDVGP